MCAQGDVSTANAYALLGGDLHQAMGLKISGPWNMPACVYIKYVYTCIYLHTNICLFVDNHMYIYVHTCLHIETHIYICTDTYGFESCRSIPHSRRTNRRL